MDYCEAHVSIKNYFTRQPYVTADGQTSLNIPVESAEWSDVIYEAKVNEISNGKVTLPSLIAFPELRPLLQQIKEGDRIEIFDKQPDVGDPVIAGFLPPNGITEEDGKTILSFVDTLGQLQWQHLRRTEYLSTSAAGLYQRAMAIWLDLVTENFPTTANFSADYSIGQINGGVPVFGPGFMKLTGNGTPACSVSLTDFPSFPLTAGMSFYMECDVTISTGFQTSSRVAQLTLWLQAFSTQGVGAFLKYWPSGASSFPQAQVTDFIVNPTVGANYSPGNGTNQVSFAMPQTHHFGVFVTFNSDGTVSLAAFLDNINVANQRVAWHYDSLQFEPQLALQADNAGDFLTVSNWRVRQLFPAFLPAARFKPQTSDAILYQPNFEDNLSFLQLVAEKDGSEFRPVYHAWPRLDELEVDLAGTLGKAASRILDYEQPAKLPTEGSPQASPLPVITDTATFLNAPVFRFEEGFNLEAAAKVLARANVHANDVIRVGASTMDAQVFGEAWSGGELGRPQSNGTPRVPFGAQYPYFEQITNDDRVGIQTLVVSLATLELARRIDPTPSLELSVVDDVPFAFRWRAGDSVFVKTQSLRFNQEQELRVQKVEYAAGSPVRKVTMGKAEADYSLLRMLGQDTMMSWLYEQSGTNPGTYVYPSLGNINSGSLSPVFSIPLDQYTTGSALVYAAFHWFADANVMNIQPFVNGTGVYTTGIAGASGTDSGLIQVTQYFQSPGTYQIQFKNNDAATRNLTAAFLVLRIKV